MTLTRRRIFRSAAAATAAGSVAPAAQSAPDLSAIRSVAVAHGLTLSDERLRLLQPVLERRQAQIRTLREFPFADSIEPTQGVPEK